MALSLAADRNNYEQGDTSKVLKADSIRYECEQSLRRLRVEVIDLYQIHWPVDGDPAEIEEGWAAMAELQRDPDGAPVVTLAAVHHAGGGRQPHRLRVQPALVGGERGGTQGRGQRRPLLRLAQTPINAAEESHSSTVARWAYL